MWAAPRQSAIDTSKTLGSRLVRPPKSCMPVAPMIWLLSSAVSRSELKRSSATLGAAEVCGGADATDEDGIVEVGVDVAFDVVGVVGVVGVDECVEQSASATATTAPAAANRMPPTGTRFGKRNSTLSRL